MPIIGCPAFFKATFWCSLAGALMLDAAKLRRRVVLRSWLATVYIVDGQGSATARGTRRHVGGCAHCICGRFCTLYLWEVFRIIFVGGVHIVGGA